MVFSTSQNCVSSLLLLCFFISFFVLSWISLSARILTRIYDDVSWLNPLPRESFQCLETLTIHRNSKLKNLGEIEKVFRGCSSSLRSLCIENCSELRSVVVGGLEHLCALEILEIRFSVKLNLSEEKEGKDGSGGFGIETYPSLLPSLHTLRLSGLQENISSLPNWTQFLPALRTLHIWYCSGLKAMPNRMPKLKQLIIEECSKILETRCKEDPEGEDWPYIQHIPNVQFIECYDECHSDEEYCVEEYSDEEHSVEGYSDEDY